MSVFEWVQFASDGDDIEWETTVTINPDTGDVAWSEDAAATIGPPTDGTTYVSSTTFTPSEGEVDAPSLLLFEGETVWMESDTTVLDYLEETDCAEEVFR